jgi:hypothetical protein
VCQPERTTLRRHWWLSALPTAFGLLACSDKSPRADKKSNRRYGQKNCREKAGGGVQPFVERAAKFNSARRSPSRRFTRRRRP